MVQKESYLEVADNSGAKALQCIHIVGSTRKRYAFIGDVIKCAVKKAIPGGMVKKGDVVDAIIVRTKKELRRADGSYIRFDGNAAVIIKQGEMIGTRIFGPIPREIRTRGYSKISSLALEVL
jgi:large subunit ribosomal protein L14